MNHHLYKTPLKDRDLWFDGESTFRSTELLRYLRLYDVKHVDVITPIVEEFNKVAPPEQKISVKNACDKIQIEWKIPEEYLDLNLDKYIQEKFINSTQDLYKTNPKEWVERAQRLSQELEMYHERRLEDVLRVIVYIINTLTNTNSVWGVGRGSSVSSYVLYILGVHDVDSFTYDLDINDFLHE